jgi:glycosyltransferase involved in cell wall biosynthesis
VRVCIIAPPWVPVPPPSYGGTEAVLDTLARGLERAGAEVLLVTTGDSECSVPISYTFEEALGVGAQTPPAEMRQVAFGYDVARSWGADIVHDHTLAGPLAGAAIADCPVVTTVHGPFLAEDLRLLYRAVGPVVPIIAISHHHAADAGPIPIGAVIHHGVDLERFPVGSGSGGFALFLGRIHPDKGVDAACRIARDAGVPLRIAAKMQEPLEQAYFEEAVRPLLGGECEYVGEATFDEKVELLGAATCLLNPIDWPEPFGMVMVEALACGTPVVARACGSAPELIDDGRTGFVAATEEELMKALAEVDTIPRDACRAEAETRFSADRMARDHLDLYERIIRDGMPAR